MYPAQKRLYRLRRCIVYYIYHRGSGKYWTGRDWSASYLRALLMTYADALVVQRAINHPDVAVLATPQVKN
jgi:hypothetical protein